MNEKIGARPIPLMAFVLLAIMWGGCGRQPAPSPSGEAANESRQTGDRRGGGILTVNARAQAGNVAETVPPLPLYELKIDPKDLAALERNPGSDETYPATFSAEHESYGAVQVRYRGEWARTWPKKPLKIFFRREKPFQGHHSVNLNSAWRDPAFVRETLAYQVYAACGVPSSRSRLVRLEVNGEFHGVYVEVEQVDKAFLNRCNLKGASLFKAVSDDNQADERDLGGEAAFAAHYQNETQKTNDLRDLRVFCHELAQTTNAAEFLARRLDIENYINYLAAAVLVQHWDGFNKNHFLVYEWRTSGKWLVLPWDLDRTFGDHWSGAFNSATLPVLLGTSQIPGVTGWNRLQDRFQNEPALRARFLNRLEELLEKEFTPTKLFPLLDCYEAQLAGDAPLDRKRWPGQDSDLHGGIAGVKTFIEQRRAYLQSELKKLRQSR